MRHFLVFRSITALPFGVGMATSPAGLIAVTGSTDGGASFAAWPEAPLLYTLGAAADRTQVVGVGTDGQIWVTGAGAASWEPAGRVDGRVQAVGMDAAGRIVIVDETSGITILPG